MDQTYSVTADFLSKFSTWPAGIQALWVVSLTLITLAPFVAATRIAMMLIRATTAGATSVDTMSVPRDIPHRGRALEFGAIDHQSSAPSRPGMAGPRFRLTHLPHLLATLKSAARKTERP